MSNMTCSKTGIEADNLSDLIKKMQDEVLKLRKDPINDDHVEWIVNEMSELGVKVNGRCFFLYKGTSYNGGEYYRTVFKREFGECCHPMYYDRSVPSFHSYIGHHNESMDVWNRVR